MSPSAARAAHPYVRCLLPDGRVEPGLLEEGAVALLRAPFWQRTERTGEVVPLGGVRLLPPCEPRVIACVGLNYHSHLHGRPIPDPPTLFFKPLSSIAGPGDRIRMPSGSEDVQPEGELVVVVGRTVHRASREEAAAAVFGYTAGLDVTARDWQRSDAQWWRAKGFDTSGVFGPAIVAGLPAGSVTVRTHLNGAEIQRGLVAELIRDVPEIVRLVSAAITLQPGDIIFTGTPGEPRPVQAGDTVAVEVSGAGLLRCTVAGPADYAVRD